MGSLYENLHIGHDTGHDGSGSVCVGGKLRKPCTPSGNGSVCQQNMVQVSMMYPLACVLYGRAVASGSPGARPRVR